MNRAPPVLVVGAGLAGLCTALACAPRHVVLVDPAADGTLGSSALAQGGIAAALGPGDSPDVHLRDTLEAGAHHNDAGMAGALVHAAPQAVAWLQAQGVAFDTVDGRLALGREGGHLAHRIVHAGGDRTGAVVMAALLKNALAAGHIEWRGGVGVDALLLRDGRVAGARLAGAGGGTELVDARAVVLATGGLGGLFARSTNPATQRGAGLALALAAGARLRDVEYVQFHPTALAVPGARLPLITEALRGAGAVLRDSHGRPAMAGRHPLGDLAPRDVVARRLWRLAREGGAWLDATGLPSRWEQAFPTVAALCRAHGVDARRTPVPVTPAAHFHMGGVAVDRFGASGVPGLFAVGEVACTGVHGANRLASNSLLECVVMGRRVGQRLAHTGAAATARRGHARLVESGPDAAAADLATLRRLLWDAAGPVRTATGLQAALADVGALPASRERAVAAALLAAAAANPRSLGAHWLEAPAALAR